MAKIPPNIKLPWNADSVRSEKKDDKEYFFKMLIRKLESMYADIANGLNNSNSYEDRGDPSAYDKTLTDFTTDNSWHDLDLSSVVGAQAKAIHMRIVVTDNAAGSFVQFRKKGNSNTYNCALIYTQVADQELHNEVIVACDKNQKIQYRTTNTTFTTINLVVKGWYK